MIVDRTSRAPLFRGAVAATVVVAALGPRPLLAGETSSAALQERIDARLEELRDELVEVRRDIHRHPEVSGKEERTAGLVAERLRALGFEVRTGVGGHGVIGLLRGGQPGPLLAFRADMDAVPSTAPDPVEFRSTVDGVRHICGHDIHTTIGLALASGFAAVKDDLPGSLELVFQPAEENATGARAMLADGALREPEPRAIFAYHTAPMPVGQFVTAPEILMPGRDQVQVTLTGTGDLEEAARRVRDEIRAVSTISDEEALQPAPPDFIHSSVGRPTKGEAGSLVVPATVTTGTASARAEAEIARRLGALELPGVAIAQRYEAKGIAGVTNDPELVRQASASIEAVVGSGTVSTSPGPTPAFSEDFGSFQQVVPGVMFFIGVSNPERGWIGMPHSPGYVADEEAIFVGARAMARVLLDQYHRQDGR